MRWLFLFWVRLHVSLWNLIEFVRTAFRYYPKHDFGWIDSYLLRHYILESPYQISKAYLLRKGEKDLYVYGETPLTALEKIAKECGLHSRDVVYELGCGRGRSCFWLHAFLGCSVYGVEQIPSFVAIAQSVKRKYRLEKVKFIHGDMLTVDLSSATVIYFYGTCSEVDFIAKLCQKLEKLPEKTKIITVSYPLSAYSSNFSVVKSFSAEFPWGEGEVFLQVPKR